MAARTAFFRQGYADARSYLTNLLESACSSDIVADALFELGDVLIEQRIPQNSTNSLENFESAIAAFERITRMGATNRLEPLAWGKIGDCHFQLAGKYPQSYDQATNAYQKILDSKRSDVPVAARNQAEVGIALTLHRLADIRTKDRTQLLKAALDHVLNVIYSKGPDPYWQQRAAIEAGKLAENLSIDGNSARALYMRFIEEIPAMKATWEAKIAALPTGPSQ
jgi:tetratricopeptide (TPR) repeat protein